MKTKAPAIAIMFGAEPKGLKESSKDAKAYDKAASKIFEKSGKDVEMKGVKEGSKKDMAMDKKQMAKMKAY